MQVWKVVALWKDYETNESWWCSYMTVAMNETVAKNKASISFWNNHHPRDVKDLIIAAEVDEYQTNLFKKLLSGGVFELSTYMN